MSSVQKMADARVATRIWGRDPQVFSPTGPADVQSISTRLGWLDAPRSMRDELPALRTFVDEARRDGLTNVYLLGMGGSSLCAEVLKDIAGGHGASLVVLDTTDERAITDAAAALVPERSVFLVASKSGTTIEVSSLERYFGSLMTRAVGEQASRHFAAITDPGTPLVDLARERRYRHTFINPADIGGRYSALSLFGLVPAALMGVDVDALLDAASAMAARCGADAPDNPGLALGTFMATSAAAGRDKLTVLLPSRLSTLGLWIEQLVAESTGKHHKGLLPVVDEPLGAPAEYGTDRAFVFVDDGQSADLAAAAQALQAAGHPVFTIAAEDLGAEFFRWEFATAVAGVGLQINPFDEPNVRDAKRRTQALLDGAKAAGALAVDPPLKPIDGVADVLARDHRADHPPSGGRYVAILDYLPAGSQPAAQLDEWRARIRRERTFATTHGVGPRYLHSTGQYHKGGPDTGIFVLLTAADATATSVPGTEYTFSTLKQAQALGDFDALQAAGRTVVHLHFDRPGTDVVGAIDAALRQHAAFA